MGRAAAERKSEPDVLALFSLFQRVTHPASAIDQGATRRSS
jgi:hypothetical protein